VANRPFSPPPPPGPEPDPGTTLLTLADVARRLRVHPKTVLRWARLDASFPVIRLSPTILRVNPAHLDRWLRSRESGQAISNQMLASRNHRILKDSARG
jgi:hypothetical protein